MEVALTTLGRRADRLAIGYSRSLELEDILHCGCLRKAVWSQTDYTNAVRCELGGYVSSECLLGGHRGAVAAVQCGALARRECRDGHDHPRFVRDHVPCGQACGQEVRTIDHVLQMPGYSLLGESVDRRRLGGSARENDHPSDRVEQ